jgi:hypothetical protein
MEVSVSSLLVYLREKRDSEMLGLFPPEDLDFPEQRAQKNTTPRSVEVRTRDSEKGCEPTSLTLLLDGYTASLTREEGRQLFGEKYMDDVSQRQIYINSARTFKLWATYIVGLILDREASPKGETERWFEPKEIKAKLKNLMPFHYDQEGAKVSILLTADVKIGSKYHLDFPCLENKAGTCLYRFVGFKV